MRKLGIEVWIQMATGIAVIIGIALVIYELQLTRQIAFTEMVQEAMSEISLRETTLMGEEASATLAKACYAPESLDESEKVILDSVFSSQINFAVRIKLLEDPGSINTIWRQNTQQATDYVMGFPQGESWMKLGKTLWDEEFNTAVSRSMEAYSGFSCIDRIALLDAK